MKINRKNEIKLSEWKVLTSSEDEFKQYVKSIPNDWSCKRYFQGVLHEMDNLPLKESLAVSNNIAPKCQTLADGLNHGPKKLFPIFKTKGKENVFC